MNIILTGASGFLGKNIYSCLSKTHNLITLGRSKKDDIYFDFINYSHIELNSRQNIDLLIHCAGSVSNSSYNDSELDKNFNIYGTSNLLKLLDNNKILPKSIIYISSVAVYGVEKGELINEDSPLLAKEIYGLSKIKAEQIIKSWCNVNKINCIILRLPLLVGLNPSGSIAEMIKGIKFGYYFNISKVNARKSVLHVDDISKILPKLININGVYNLTDNYHPTMLEISKLISSQLKRKTPLCFPLFIIKLLAIIGDFLPMKFPLNSKKLNKLIYTLTFDDSKAKKDFAWNPNSILKTFIIYDN
jgi:nucleoside-diphosphate-sugar epimerase